MDLTSTPKFMKALRLDAFNQPYSLYSDIPVPEPSDGEVLVRVRASGFCHTDYQVFDGTFKPQLPITPSHEPAGVVVSLGSGVPEEWNIGDRVGVINFKNPCKTCGGCLWAAGANGFYDARHCENRTMSGIIRADGAFSEYMIAKHYALIHLPNKLPFEQAAPLMCAGAAAWNALNIGDFKISNTIAILGVGGVGSLAMQFAKARGYRVVAIDKSQKALNRVSKVPPHLQADLLVNYSSPDVSKEILDFTGGVGLHGAIGCAEDVPALSWILHQLQPRGTLVMVAHPSKPLEIDSMNLIFRELSIKGAVHCPTEEVKKMMQVVSEHDVISHITVIGLEDGENIIKRHEQGDYSGRLVIKL